MPGERSYLENPSRVSPCSLFPVPCSLFPVPCSLFPVPCSLFPVPCSLFPVPCSLFPVPCSLFPVPCSLFPVPCSSIQPRQERHALARMQMPRQVLRPRAVVVMRPDPHPVRMPILRKLDHARLRIPRQQFLLVLDRHPLAAERPDLHAPPPARPDRLRRPVNVHAHPVDPVAVNSHRLRRRNRQVHNPSRNERPAVGNAHSPRLPGFEIRHHHQRTQRQRPVRCRHRLIIQRIAIGLLPPAVVPVPGGHPH